MLPTTKTAPKAQLSDYTVLLFGASKAGKTIFCSHAQDVLFLATEPGLNALEVFQVSITKWEDMLQACAEIAEGKHQFKTIIIDTIDNAYKMCADHMYKKSGVDQRAEALGMSPTSATARGMRSSIMSSSGCSTSWRSCPTA